MVKNHVISVMEGMAGISTPTTPEEPSVVSTADEISAAIAARKEREAAEQSVDLTHIGTAVYKMFQDLPDRDKIMTEPMTIAWAARRGAEMALRLQAEEGEQ